MIFIKLFEDFNNLDSLYKIAKGNDYNTFLDKTDSLVYNYNILYRGSSEYDRVLFNECFMTDYIGHAREYGEDIDGILYDKNDLIYFDNYTFNELREYFEDFEDFNKCNEIIIEWDFYLDGHRITYLQNILYKAITEIRNQKIEQILNE